MSSITQNQRINFASIKNQLEYPDFLEVQLKSFQDFFQMDTAPEKRKTEGLYKVFSKTFLSPTQEITSSSNFSTTTLTLHVIRLKNVLTAALLTAFR